MPFIDRNNIVLHYQWLDQKRDKTVVLINSLGTSLMIWEKLVPLVTTVYNVLLFDKRGHGLSSTQEGPLSIDDYADDVIYLMDYLSIKKANVLGLSIGGLITYSLASRYPDRFEKLIFSNTGAKIGTKEAWNERIQAIEENGIAFLSAAIMERWLSAHFREQHPAETAGYANLLERNTTLGYVQACAAIRDADFNPVLEKIKHPTMFIGGSEDAGTSPEFVKENARKLGAERVAIIAGVGHLPCLEQPAEVASLMLDFYQDDTTLSLYEQGMKTRRAVLGDEHVDRAEANKTDFDEAFQTYITNSAWGAIWSRPHLTKRERSMITIALLATLGHEEELAMHIRATQNTGATVEDIKEVLLHVGVYAGVPVTNQAMKIAKSIYHNDQT